MVRYLVSKGANLNAVISIENKNGDVYYLTALDMADLYEAKAIKEVLKKREQKPPKTLKQNTHFLFLT